MKLFKLLVLAIAVLSLVACSKDKAYDHKKAISVFLTKNSSELDSSLADVKIKIPKAEVVDYWYNSSVEEKIANKAFLAEFKKKSIITFNHHLPFQDRLVYSPIIADGKVFTLDYTGNLSSYSLQDHKKIYSKKIFAKNYFRNYQNAKISYFDGKIFAVLGSNKISAVNAVTGEIIWLRTISSIPTSTPIASGNMVYVITNENKTYAFDIKDGSLKWTHLGIAKNTAIFGSANPVVSDNYLISTYSSGEIYALNTLTGKAIWSSELNTNKATSSDFYLNDIDATPIIKNNVVYAIGNGGIMAAIKIVDGNFIWQKELSGISNFLIAGDFIYLITNENKILAINSDAGGIKWAKQLPNFASKNNPKTKHIYNGVIMAGNKLIITDKNGKLIAINPLDGATLKEYKLGGKLYHNPVAVNSKLYVNLANAFSLRLVEIR